jgi:hypothetical protein
MVVFSSGIVDVSRAWLGAGSGLQPVWLGAGSGAWWVGVAHCWVLRDQAALTCSWLSFGGGLGVVWGSVGCSVAVALWLLSCGVMVPPFGCWFLVWGWWWLVGLLFEIWIVDASIF